MVDTFYNEAKRVIIEFPNDINKLVKILDWMYNSGDFMRVYMMPSMIKELNKITNVVEIEDNED